LSAQQSVKVEQPNTSQISQAEIQSQLQIIYSNRFEGLAHYLNEVWKVLVRHFFSRWVRPDQTILDLGCGYGEFINNVNTAKKFAMDLNPTTKNRLRPDVQFLEQDCSAPWPLPTNSLDIIFTSNFFEHLPCKSALQATLLEAYGCLKPGGHLIALGPNVRYLSGEYWDFFDHHLALTERSLAEVLIMSGFTVEMAVPKFLPYTMSQGFRPPLFALHFYLKLPFVWHLFGRQFLVVGRKAV
jgi:SAM-dependent methyltransferase